MEMRRKDRMVDNPDELRLILEECKVCRIATMDEEGLYIVPLNFGYEYDGNKLTLYVHSARDGRKVRAFKNNAAVAFEMDTGHELVEDNMACQYGYRYKSITGNGWIHELDDNGRKGQRIKYTDEPSDWQRFRFRDKMVNAGGCFQN